MTPAAHSSADVQNVMKTPARKLKYFPDMISWVTEEIQTLVEEGTPPGEIVVLAPFMPDVIRFTLSNQLDKLGIPHQSHRPSRSLRDEPATQTMLTLASAAFTSWELLPKRINLALALTQAIRFGPDPLANFDGSIYRPDAADFPLDPFEAAQATETGHLCGGAAV